MRADNARGAADSAVIARPIPFRMHLKGRFDEVTAILQGWKGWQTNRLNPPALITTELMGLRIPTAAEMLRVKAFLLTERRATRDYVDVAALTLHLGMDAASEAATLLNLIYGPRTPLTWISVLAEACESEPADLAAFPLAAYKGLRAPLTDWSFVAAQCRDLGCVLLKRELSGGLPAALPRHLTQEPPP